MRDAIQITIKSVYGHNVAYPSNYVAEQLAKIASTKTLTPQVLTAAFEMGCAVEVLGPFGEVSKTFKPHGEDHPAANWQDQKLADAWLKAMTALDCVADGAAIAAVSP
jgi:hypothetical protein